MSSYSNGHGDANGNGYGNGNGHGGSKGRRNGGTATTPLAIFGDRLPPQNIEAEQGVIGAILLHNDVLHDIVPILQAEDFYRDAHQILYRAIRELYDKSKAVDAVTLADELQRRGDLEKVGGDETLLTILNSVPHAAHAKYHAQIVKQKSVMRQLIGAAHEIIEDGYSGLKTAEQVLETAESKVFKIAEEKASGETHDMRLVLAEAMERISHRAEEKHPVTGISSGWLDVDALTCGLHPSQLIIVAARPSMGKTAFALNLCQAVALNQGKPVLFVSLEMGRLEIAERLLCGHSGVEGGKIRSGKLQPGDLRTLADSFGVLQAAPLFIDETAARTVLQINANARRLQLRQGISMIVIDYIQLVDGEEGRDSRQEQIAKISRRLKTMARELEVPVIALSQLNRAVEQREDRRPRMADLRESGAIEQDADIIMLLHRPEYYDPNDQPGVAEVIVAKNRNGATGTAKLQFERQFMRFRNLYEGAPIPAAPDSPF